MSRSKGALAGLVKGSKVPGVDIDAVVAGECGPGSRVVVVQASMEQALEMLGRGGRDQVVMTRINGETAQTLDRWVDAGVAKSRSEAAALFLTEGLKLRAPELADLGGAIADYEGARERLRKKAQAVMGKPAERK